MIRRFDDLWDSSATDGASAPIGLSIPPSASGESQDLMEAWFKERQESIENGLYLDLACQLLKQIMTEGAMTLESQRRAKHLISAVKQTRGRGRRGGDA
jgi:hypothetical protein